MYYMNQLTPLNSFIYSSLGISWYLVFTYSSPIYGFAVMSVRAKPYMGDVTLFTPFG